MLDLNKPKNNLQIQNKSRSRLSNQKATHLSKSDSIKKNKKHKPIAFNTIKQKIPKSKRQINSKTVDLQNLQNQLQFLRKKKHVRLTVPFVNSVKLSTSKQKKFQGNSKSLQKTHKKAFKIHSHEQKPHLSQIKPQTSKSNKKPKSNTKSNGTTNKKPKNPQNLGQQQSKINSKCKSGSQSTKKSLKGKKQITQILKAVKKACQQKVSKTSCITINISKDSSKEKWNKNTNIELDSKFKKKNQVNICLEKKTKKANIHSSSKLSSRNSYKFVETKSNEFLIVNSCYDSANPEKQNFPKSKQSNKSSAQPQTMKKVNSETNIYEKLKDYIELRKQTIAEGNCDNKSSQFKKSKQQLIFNQSLPQQKVSTNIKKNEVTIQKLLQATEDEIHFNLGCQQNEEKPIKQQPLSQIQQFSFQRLKNQEQDFRQSQFQELSIYESLYFSNNNNNGRSYSVSSDLFKIAQQNNIDFTSLEVEKNTEQFMERMTVLDWVSMLTQKLMLKTETYHLACGYYDIYLANFRLEGTKSNYQKKLVGLSCLLIAIKMDEREYQHDVLNAIITLEKDFLKKDIVKTELQILKKLKLKLKLQTLSFWSDYFSSKWDPFIDAQADALKVSVDKLFLRQVDGKSYENHRKVVSILNAIILDGGIFQHGLIEIVLSVFYSVLKEIILQENKQKTLQQINISRQNRQSIALDEKYIFKNYVTRDTLDELSQSDLKDHQHQNSGKVFASSQTLIKKNFASKGIIRKDFIQQTLFQFTDIFSQFTAKTCKKTIKQLETSIKYVSDFIDLKIFLEMDQKVYNEARNYEEFIRYHTHSPFVQTFLLERNSKFSKQNDDLPNIPQINDQNRPKKQLTNVEVAL